MRTDQYIGLNYRASAFIRAQNLQYDGFYEIEGVWNKVSLGVWSALSKFKEYGYIFIERVQASPWSSGPMYYTSLWRMDIVSGRIVAETPMFEWLDSEMEGR